MSLCDPDPGRSSERDCDVTATAPRNVNELAGVGDVRFKLARPEDQKKNHCSDKGGQCFQEETAKAVD